MAAVPQVTKTYDEAMDAIRQMAQAAGDDFRVKVLKRNGPSPSAPTEMIATYAAARVEHFAMPEAWLTQLAGGGSYVLVALHESEPNTPAGVLVLTPITGPAKQVDAGAVLRPGWTGPGTQLFPAVPPSHTSSAAPSVRTLFGQPDAAGAVEDAGARASVPAALAASGPSLDRIMEARFSMMDAQRRSDAEQITKMLDAQAKATDRQIAALTDVVKTVAQRPTAEPKSIVDQIVPLVAALAPVITPLISANKEAAAEARKLAAEENARREAREAEARKMERDMLMQMNERASNASNDMMKVIAPMVDAVSQMGRTVLQQVATMQEMTAPPAQEEGLGGLVREGARALAEVMATKRAEIEAGMHTPQRALPQNTQPQVQPPATPAPSGEITEEQFKALPAEEVIGEIVAALKAKHTASEVADGYMMALGNAGFAHAVEAAGGPLKLFGPHLASVLTQPGMADYVRSVVGEIQQRGGKV